MTATRLLTAEDLYAMGSDSQHELVRGVLTLVCPVTLNHGKRAGRVYWLLQNYMFEHPIGNVAIETGYTLARDPDVVRAPDVSVVLNGRIPEGAEDQGFLELAPDLAVEIIPPGDRAGEAQLKLQDYLDAGTRRVWLLYPRTKTVMVHRPDGSAHLLSEGDTLDGEDVLPSFAVSVAALFA